MPPLSEELKIKTAKPELLGSGGMELKLVSGGIVSIIQVKEAGVVSISPVPLVART